MIIRDNNWNRDLDQGCQVSQKLIAELISKMEVVKILPYRHGVVKGTIDYTLECSNSSEGLEDLRRLHRVLAGDKTDNHQIIILKGAILKFSDFSVYVYLDATEVDENKSM
ncbi:MAG: hypothetical protein M0P49_01050 [Bacilli bacterium]|nr:hypothetical protein [Bacilli bacterium]